MIFHGASAIGGSVVWTASRTLGMNWAERFEGGAWQPLRAEDVTVFLQVGMDYIPVDATDRNMAGLAAVARLISPGVSDRAGQVAQLLKETRDARQASAVTAPVVPLRAADDCGGRRRFPRRAWPPP